MPLIRRFLLASATRGEPVIVPPAAMMLETLRADLKGGAIKMSSWDDLRHDSCIRVFKTPFGQYSAIVATVVGWNSRVVSYSAYYKGPDETKARAAVNILVSLSKSAHE